jgi:hypothetical protein
MLEEHCKYEKIIFKENTRIKYQYAGKRSFYCWIRKCSLSNITEECKREIDDTRENFEMSLTTYERTIPNLQEELKSKPKFLKIPPFQSPSNPEVAELKKSLKEKEEMILICNTEFERKLIELHDKHNSEIEEYKNRVNSLKKENSNQGNSLN